MTTGIMFKWLQLALLLSPTATAWLSHKMIGGNNIYDDTLSSYCLLLRRTNNFHTQKQIQTQTITQLHIWSPNNNQQQDINAFPYTSTSSSSVEEANISAHIIDASLHSNAVRMAQLAKIAVAFSPSQTKLALKDVEYVRVIAVDGEHMELEAVVCEDDGCITVFVPVRFPWSCGGGDSSSSMEECVLSNVNELDAQASTAVVVETNNGDAASSSAFFHYVDQHVVDVDDIELNANANNAYPDWWVHAEEQELWEECDNLRRILNEEDFTNEVKALVCYAHELLEQTARFELKKVKVVAVGPAGILFRAKAIEDSSGNGILLEVPFSFGGILSNSEQMRSAVLGAIAGVNIMD